jgi:adenylate cyclase
MSDAVLIVDDERNVLQSFKRLLHREGYDLYLAESGREALEIIGKTDLAVIVCDQRMPEMSGAQVLAEAYRLQPDAIRITLTGHTDLHAAQASINEGHVSHFLFKPCDDEVLLSVVRKSVDSYRLVQENRRLEELARKQQDELQSWSQHLEKQVRETTDGLRARNENLLALQRQLDQSLRDTVKLVSGMLELNSPNLGIHCSRVAELARELAARLDINEESLREVEIAARLHDVGKLSKLAARASTRERMTGRIRIANRPTHTEAGFALLSKVSGFERIALAVRHQHERFDGSGTPDGLKGDNIPIASRIIAITSAYDKAVFSAINPTDVSHWAGCKALRQGRGTLFDPGLVDLFLRHFENIDTSTLSYREVEISTKKLRAGMVLTRPVRNIDGLFMLKEGVIITRDLADHLHALGDVDPHIASVFVKCEIGMDNRSTDCETGESYDDLPPAYMEHRPMDAKHACENAVGEPSGQSTNYDAASGPHRVLIVDDSAPLCSALKRELRSADINVETTENGWTALRLVENGQFDAVLVDLLMPAMSGEELIARLEKVAPAIPCIILTANATKERVLALTHKPNVAAILVKPWQHDRLVSTIMATIAKGHPH